MKSIKHLALAAIITFALTSTALAGNIPTGIASTIPTGVSSTIPTGVSATMPTEDAGDILTGFTFSEEVLLIAFMII